MTKAARGWDPKLWASLKPFGVGEQRPNNYAEIWKAIWENRDRLGYSWRILKNGVCDGCALGTTGMKDWTLDGIHLCNVRLRLLRLNTIPPLNPALLGDCAELRNLTGSQLRGLGRLPHPMVREPGDKGFTRVPWDDILELIATRIRAARPERIGFYLTSRGIPNETYYAVQKAVRALGSNSIDNAARVCHSPSTFGLKQALGVAASTCSYKDWIGTDLIVFIGSNVANNQPVAMKYLYHAKRSGTKVAVINSYREPGMERYWVPSVVESGLFGTKIADHFFMVDTGGDIGFLNGSLKHMIEQGWVDGRFIEEHTAGFEGLKGALENQQWPLLEQASGSSQDDMLAFAKLVAEAKTAVFVWSMGITQHECGEDNVRSILNLALSKGFVGRSRCGLMPIRGHSGVQGGAEMGAYSTAFPGGISIDSASAEWLAQQWGFDVPDTPGMTAPQMIDAAHDGRLDVLFCVGGNFLEVLPDPVFVEEALGRVGLRIHMDVVPSSHMLADSAGTVVLLPATTRYEIPGGVTETSTERRVIFSPEIPGPRAGESRPEWEVVTEIARRVRPDLSAQLSFADTGEIREEIARLIPFYDGIQNLRKAGDQFQYGGAHLCEGWTFPTPDGKAHFYPVSPPSRPEIPEGRFLLSTRRGKQFNSMVQESKDSITGAWREAILISPSDMELLSLKPGDRVKLASDAGEFVGFIHPAPVKPRNLQVHWPEGEVLIDRSNRSPEAGIPDYNAVVSLEKVAGLP
jgi:molybdopterin-dependent oxidoreductase alpha subunit